MGSSKQKCDCCGTRADRTKSGIHKLEKQDLADRISQIHAKEILVGMFICRKCRNVVQTSKQNNSNFKSFTYK